MPGLHPLFPADMQRLALARQTVRRPDASALELSMACDTLADSADWSDQQTARRIRNEMWATKGSEIIAADNFRAVGDGAARIARLCADMGQTDSDEPRRPTVIPWLAVFLALLVAAFLLGFGMVWLGAYVGAKTEATVAMAAERGSW